jgi:hypothetical protein
VETTIMANSKFPIPLGRAGTSNARVLNALRSGRIPYAIGHRYWWECRVRAGDFAGAAATAQTLDLNVLYPANAFPADVKRLAGSYIRIDRGISGGSITDADLELGRSGDTDALLTVTPAFTGDEGTFATPAAAEYASRPAPAFAPTLRILTTGGNTNAIEEMDVTVFVPFTPLPA